MPTRKPSKIVAILLENQERTLLLQLSFHGMAAQAGLGSIFAEIRSHCLHPTGSESNVKISTPGP